MDHHYRFAILSADLTEEAILHNRTLLGPQTLGIEVTSKPLAAECGLGNIDPQHVQGGKSSAIEEALTAPLPPRNAYLVTIREDMDSIGAMAVLSLRAWGRGDDIDTCLIAWIGAIDRMGVQDARRKHSELIQRKEITQALHSILRWNIPLEEKVREISRILTHDMSRSEVDSLAQDNAWSNEDFNVVMHGPVAFVVAPRKYKEARQWANRLYQIALIQDPMFKLNSHTQVRWTVIRQEGYFDREGFVRAINLVEASARSMSVEALADAGLTWGGATNIISSPVGYGRDSKLSTGEIIQLVRDFAESGIVS